MSQQNVDSGRAIADAFNRRDWDAFVALADDDISVESRLVAMEGAYQGHEGLRRWWDNFLGTFPDYTVEIEELRDFGDVTLAHVRGWGHGADSATPIVDPFWQPARWRNGKCVWWRNCATEEEALEAAGCRSSSDYSFGREAAIRFAWKAVLRREILRRRCRRRTSRS
jgi:hypothetical protein